MGTKKINDVEVIQSLEMAQWEITLESGDKECATAQYFQVRDDGNLIFGIDDVRFKKDNPNIHMQTIAVYKKDTWKSCKRIE
jgi:hypothetical protein